MGAARRSCVRAVVLTALLSAIVGSALPACQFPNYGFASGNAGSLASGGMSGSAGQLPGDGGSSAGDSGGSAGDGGDSGAGGDAPLPSFPCPATDCITDTVPGDWIGPVMVWEGMRGDPPPECQDGYVKTLDSHHGLNAPPGDCTCACAALHQDCAPSTSLIIHPDQTCHDAPCATATAPQTCSTVSGCVGSQGSISAETPVPSGGSCEATVTAPSKPTWDFDVRVCKATRAGVCDDPSQVCAPLPQLPFPTSICVMRGLRDGETPPECPAAFQTRLPLLYDNVMDGRGCTECGCGSPKGGTCKGTKLVMTSTGDCSKGVEYLLDDKADDGTCKPFNLGSGNIRPTHVGATYQVQAGTCDVVTPSQATDGVAVPTGNFAVVCCQ